jgi:hypothetical protein
MAGNAHEKDGNGAVPHYGRGKRPPAEAPTQMPKRSWWPC